MAFIDNFAVILVAFMDLPDTRQTSGGLRASDGRVASARPLISIITVVYNRVNDLRKTFDSVSSQDRASAEYIVIDGGSKDGTRELIGENDDKIDYWISEPDKGIYDAMNKGIALARGEWIIFMNAGDLFYDGSVLKTCGPLLQASSQYVIAYGDAEIVSGAQKHIQYQQGRHLDLTKSIIHQSMFIRTGYLQDSPYDTRYKIMADYDNLLKVSAIAPETCRHIPVIVCRYDKTGVSSRPLYTYFAEYYAVARHRMKWMDFLWFNVYIFPRLFWSFRLIAAR